MFYYIDTIEQVKKVDEETGEESVNEYGAREKVADYNLAESKYFTKLSNVANDIGKNHYYMNIQLCNSEAGRIRQDEVGEYVPDDEE